MIRHSVSALLVLQDGTVFHGKSCGKIGISTGEIAFNTAMTGYQEVFTDPSYFGQVLVMATAHIGNYGVHADEVESDSCKVAGVVIKKFSDVASRIGPIGTLQDYLERDGAVGTPLRGLPPVDGGGQFQVSNLRLNADYVVRSG